MKRIILLLGLLFPIFFIGCDKEDENDNIQPIDYKSQYDYFVNIEIKDNGFPCLIQIVDLGGNILYGLSDDDSIPETHYISMEAIRLFDEYDKDNYINWASDCYSQGELGIRFGKIVEHKGENYYYRGWDDYYYSKRISKQHCQFEINITN